MYTRYRITLLPAIALMAACSTTPASPSGTATVTTPGPVSPANGAQLANSSQPLTLTVSNAFVSGAADGVSYTFEVASDSSFGTVVMTKTVPQTVNQTAAALDLLAPARDYYWRVRTTSGNTVGVNTTPLKFSIGAAVVLQAPVVVGPAANEYLQPKGEVFTVANAASTGPVGPLTYRFEFATSQSFSTVLASASVDAGVGQTSFTASAGLPEETTLFWRAQAIDAVNRVNGPFSTPRAIRTTATIDLRAVDYQRFVNISNWPETDRIIAVDQDGGDGYICIAHTKRGLWPASPFLGDAGTLTEGTQWYFARINGKWYGGAGEWVRPNQICKDGQTSAEIGPDGSWGGPMSTWLPRAGELVGYMMSTPARTWPAGKTLDERSNVVVLPWKVFGSTGPSVFGFQGVR